MRSTKSYGASFEPFQEIAKLIKKYEIDDGLKYVATAIDDSKKGESVILLVSCEKTECEKIEKIIKEAQIPALFKPSKILRVESIPVLGSGKVDFKGAKDLAQKLLNV